MFRWHSIAQQITNKRKQNKKPYPKTLYRFRTTKTFRNRFLDYSPNKTECFICFILFTLFEIGFVDMYVCLCEWELQRHTVQHLWARYVSVCVCVCLCMCCGKIVSFCSAVLGSVSNKAISKQFLFSIFKQKLSGYISYPSHEIVALKVSRFIFSCVSFLWSRENERTILKNTCNGIETSTFQWLYTFFSLFSLV